MPATPTSSPVVSFVAVEPRTTGTRQTGQADQQDRPYRQLAEQLGGDESVPAEAVHKARQAGKARSDAPAERSQGPHPDEARDRHPMLAFIEGIGVQRSTGQAAKVDETPIDTADPIGLAGRSGRPDPLSDASSGAFPDTPALDAGNAGRPGTSIDDAMATGRSSAHSEPGTGAEVRSGTTPAVTSGTESDDPAAMASEDAPDPTAGLMNDSGNDAGRAKALRHGAPDRADIASASSSGLSETKADPKPGVRSNTVAVAGTPDPSPLAGSAARDRASDLTAGGPSGSIRPTGRPGDAPLRKADPGSAPAAIDRPAARHDNPNAAAVAADPAVMVAAGRLAAASTPTGAARATRLAPLENDGPIARRPTARIDARERSDPDRSVRLDAGQTDPFSRAMTAASAGDPGLLRTPDAALSGPDGGLVTGPGASAAPEREAVGPLPGAEAGDTFAPLEFSAEADSARVTDQLADRVTIAIRREMQHAELQVRPAGLGPIQVDISMEDGQANIQFTAAHPDTRLALQQSLPDLRDMLARQGIDLGRADVGQQSSGGASDRPAPGSPFVATAGNSTGRPPIDEQALGHHLSPRPARAGPGRVDLFA